MKHILLFSLIALTACKNSKEKTIESESAHHGKVLNPVEKYHIEGFYTGTFVPNKYHQGKEFFDNKITICIDSLNEDNLYGHSIVAGMIRPFNSTYTKEGEIYSVVALEPGDNKYDGKFEFNVDRQKEILIGKWVSNDTTLTVTERTYELNKRKYRYDPSLSLPEEIEGQPMHNPITNSDSSENLTKDVLKNNASIVLLKSRDVENMYKADLEVLRNSIYARHGLSFKNVRMRLIFDGIDWYMPVSIDVHNDLTEVEEKNIALIKRYETHSAKYYDAFGR